MPETIVGTGGKEKRSPSAVTARPWHGCAGHPKNSVSGSWSPARQAPCLRGPGIGRSGIPVRV